MLVLAVLMFMMLFVYQAFTSFYPSYLADGEGTHPEPHGGLYSGFFMLGILIQPVIGGFTNRVGSRAS